MTSRTLVAGIGNVFLSDDAFGVEAANHLASRTLPAGVRVEDYGIRGIHLAYELLEGYDALVLLDAVPMGESPGTLAVIEPELVPHPPAGSDPDASPVDAHTMSPDIVLATLARLGGSVGSRRHRGLPAGRPARRHGPHAGGPGRRRPRRGPVPRSRRRPRPSQCPTRRKGNPPMIRRLFASLLLAVVAGLVIKSLPDIARYLKMREM